MTALPVPVRFSENQIESIDRMVDEGVGETRSEVIRRAVERLDDAIQRTRIGEAIAESYRRRPQSSVEDSAAMAAAIALAEAEPWVWTEDGRCIPECVAIAEGIPIAPGPPPQHSGFTHK